MFPTILRRRCDGPDPAERADDVPPATEGGRARRRWVVHPFLIAVFPILALYAHNLDETMPRSLVGPIAVALAGTLAVWLPLRWLGRDGRRAGLATSFLVVAFYGFNSCATRLNNALTHLSSYWVPREYDVHPLVVLAFLAPFIAGGLFAIYRLVKNAGTWTTYLNIFALILVALPAVNAAQAWSRGPGAADVRGGRGIPTTTRPEPLPDIYHIVLDAYARSDVMNELYHFDNEEFLARLERKGFFVARRATANYCQTTLSVSSTLNCDYLDRLTTLSQDHPEVLETLIRDSRVVRSLRPHGYRFVAFASGYGPIECQEADLYLGPHHPTDAFHVMMIRMTPLRFLPFRWGSWDFYTAVRARVQYILDHLPDVAAREEPTFTYAHIVSPHPPFVFGENGEDISPREGSAGPNGGIRHTDLVTPREYEKNYRRQAIYLTGQIERTIDRILANSPVPPIIILQSDHGSGLRHHLDDLEQTDLHERLSILSCYYFPGRNYDALKDDITPVNSYRVVLNTFFGAGLPLREDRNFFSTYGGCFNFVDVTERLRSGKDRGRVYTPPSFYSGMIH